MKLLTQKGIELITLVSNEKLDDLNTDFELITVDSMT